MNWLLDLCSPVVQIQTLRNKILYNHVCLKISEKTIYSKTCLIWHLSNPFPYVIQCWISFPNDNLSVFYHCVIWHPVHSLTQHVRLGFTVQVDAKNELDYWNIFFRASTLQKNFNKKNPKTIKQLKHQDWHEKVYSIFIQQLI